MKLEFYNKLSFYWNCIYGSIFYITECRAIQFCVKVIILIKLSIMFHLSVKYQFNTLFIEKSEHLFMF